MDGPVPQPHWSLLFLEGVGHRALALAVGSAPALSLQLPQGRRGLSNSGNTGHTLFGNLQTISITEIALLVCESCFSR